MCDRKSHDLTICLWGRKLLISFSISTIFVPGGHAFRTPTSAIGVRTDRSVNEFRVQIFFCFNQMTRLAKQLAFGQFFFKYFLGGGPKIGNRLDLCLRIDVIEF